MKIKNVELFVYRLPFSSPIRLQSETLDQRYGTIVRLESEDGRIAHGEIAPLPYYSKETVIDAAAQLRTIKNDIIATDFNPEFWESELLNLFAKWRLQPHPSTLFGLESAFFKLIENEPAHSEIPICGFLHGDRQTIIDTAKAMIYEGYTALKVKLSPFDPSRAISLVNELLSLCESKAVLCLDLNRTWSLAGALEFGRKFYPNAFEYIEEPCTTFEESVEFSKRSGHPIAADESVRERSLSETLSTPSLKAIVLKPTLYGGAQFCIGLAKMAQNRGISTTFSSSYESTLGLSDIARLHLRSQNKSPVGIGTANIFSSEPFIAQMQISKGLLRLNPEEKLCLSKLKTIAL